MPVVRNVKASIQALAEKKQRKAAEVILLVFASFFSTLAGADDKPSKFWEALARIPGVNKAALELVQDIMLMVSEILEAVRDNLDNPHALGASIPTILLKHGIQIIDDVKDLKSDGSDG